MDSLSLVCIHPSVLDVRLTSSLATKTAHEMLRRAIKADFDLNNLTRVLFMH